MVHTQPVGSTSAGLRRVMSESMVEKVVAALEAAIQHDADMSAGFGFMTEEDRAAIARAAIEAMREPTEAMVRAGPLGAAAGYRDMIDAALQEKP